MRWFILFPMSFVVTLIVMLFAPVIVLFSDADGKLPSWLVWAGTLDNPLDGDSGFQSEHAPFLGAQTGWRRYINRVFWLWRNPAYGFDIRVCGATLVPGDAVGYWGTLNTSDQGTPGCFIGWCDGYWDFYLVWRYSTNYCFRFRAGWKLQTFAQAPGQLTAPTRAQINLRIMPMAAFTPLTPDTTPA